MTPEPTAVTQLQALILRDQLPLTVVRRSLHHWQVCGGLHLVNWYPTSRRFTAYLQGAVSGLHNATPRVVADLAMGKGQRAADEFNDKPRAKLTDKLRKLYRRNPKCGWCGVATFLGGYPEGKAHLQATAEHRVPRSRGGSDRMDNLMLACEGCNRERGNSLGAPAGRVVTRFDGSPIDPTKPPWET